VKRRVLIRPAADRDLDEQAEYLAAHQSLEMALRFYRAAEQTFRLLASQPKIGKVTAYRSPFLAGMRMFPLKRFSKYLVFYRLLESGIEIIRVLHGARDIESLFEGQANGK
jgi:toxin ParE1/3/4